MVFKFKILKFDIFKSDENQIEKSINDFLETVPDRYLDPDNPISIDFPEGLVVVVIRYDDQYLEDFKRFSK